MDTDLCINVSYFGRCNVKMSKKNSSRIEQKFVVEHFLTEMKEALSSESAQLYSQHHRKEDEAEMHENIMSILFPNEDETAVLKRELTDLTMEDYIETLKDKKFPNKSETRIFAKQFNGDYVFLHVRIELLEDPETGDTHQGLITSLHFCETELPMSDFPYKKVEENEYGEVE